MPIAAIVAIKASLDQTTIAAAQRLTGALIGAAAAALLLLIPASEHGLRLFAVDRGLEVVALVLLMHGVAIRFWNYALYTGIIAAAALTLVDLPHPSNYAAEGDRVLWTLCGVGIGVLVMLLGGLIAKRTAVTTPGTSPRRHPPAVHGRERGRSTAGWGRCSTRSTPKRPRGTWWPPKGRTTLYAGLGLSGRMHECTTATCASPATGPPSTPSRRPGGRRSDRRGVPGPP